MSVHTLFIVITNLFGLNFYEQKVSLALVLFLHFVGSFFAAFHILYSSYINNTKFKGIYIFADFVQLGIPFLIKNYFLYQAIRMANYDLKFNEKVKKIYDPLLVKKNEKKFLIYFLTNVVLTASKLILSRGFNGFMYGLCQVFSALVCSLSDFLVVFHMRCLSDYIKFVTHKKTNNKEEIYEIIEIKRLVHKRFDRNLFLTISSYFLLMIIALFWIFIRIAFGFLKTIYGKTNEVWIILAIWIL